MEKRVPTKEVDVEQYDTWKCANNTRCRGSRSLQKIVEHNTKEQEDSKHGLCAAPKATEETATHRLLRNEAM